MNPEELKSAIELANSYDEDTIESPGQPMKKLYNTDAATFAKALIYLQAGMESMEECVYEWTRKHCQWGFKEHVDGCDKCQWLAAWGKK